MYGDSLNFIGDRSFLIYVIIINILGFWKLIDIIVWLFKHISIAVN
jgi:hypothetical protein